MPSTVRVLVAPFLAVLILTALFSPVFAQAAGAKAADTNGTITVTGGGVALGVGVSWGHGVLTYRGQTYKLKTSGLSVVDIGASSYSGNGTVTNLKQVSDIVGNYQSVALGATVAGGGGVSSMKNDKGVVIKLNATTKGLKFTAAPQGITIKLDK
jgi:hypothetical protein